MKRLIAILLAALMLCGVCSAEETARVFVHGFDAEYMPYSYMDDNGDYTGFDVEMCKAICDLLGWQYEPFAVNWDTKDQELYAFACDCIWSGFTINGREEEYAWSIPYVDNSQVILTRVDTGINGSADLAGRMVGVEAGTSALELLEDDSEEGLGALAATFAELLRFNSYLSAFTDLQAGAIDAIIIDIGVAQAYVREYGDEYVIAEEILATEQYGIGFRLEETELRDTVNEALMTLVQNGTYAELAAKYELTDSICISAD